MGLQQMRITCKRYNPALVLNTILKSADVIEHIAQDAVCGVSNKERARRLMAALEGSELIVQQF